MKIVAIVLTLNEEIHIERCLTRLQSIVTDIIVVDSYSSDNTVNIAKNLGAIVLQNKWINYAHQFQYGLENTPTDADWVMRVDADEYLSDEYIADIKSRLPELSQDVSGVYCGLRRIFQGKMINYGAVNITMLRLWRNGRGRMETRWMDEHIRLDGDAVYFRGYIVDHNLNPLSWWIDKHNGYSAREVVDILTKKYNLNQDKNGALYIKSPFGVKRFIKEHIYNRLPCGLRAFLYFCFRYIFALGFIDGFAGFSFHFLQGFWYRFLVDAKLKEVEMVMKERNVCVVTAIRETLNIDIRNE